MTDSVSAHALGEDGYPVPRAAVAALAAGEDLVLFGTGINDDPALPGPVIAAIVGAVHSGDLSRATLVDAVAHVLAAKGVDLCAAAGG